MNMTDQIYVSNEKYGMFEKLRFSFKNYVVVAN